MSIDAPTREFMDDLLAAGGRPLPELSPAEARALIPTLGELMGPAPDIARSEDVTLSTADGDALPVRILTPGTPPVGVIVYLHGGGWVIGDIDGCDNLGRRLANRTGCVVVLPGYRKAPEHRYPAAVDDAWHALQWTAANLVERDGLSLPLIVAGDSAGGNLAAVLTLLARDQAGPGIALQVLVYPVTDCDLDTASYLDPANQLLTDRGAMAWFWDHYVPDITRRTEWRASPLRAADLSGLPPALVITAEHDPLRDEGESYAARLRHSGVPVLARRFEGQMHAFFTMLDILPASADGIDLVVDVIARTTSAAKEAQR